MVFFPFCQYFSGSQITFMCFVFTHDKLSLSSYSSSLYCLNSTKSINTKVGDLIYNYLASLLPMIQHLELIIQEIIYLLPMKLDVEMKI